MSVSYILPYLPVNTYRIEYLFTAYGKASRSLARLDGMLSEKSYANVLLSPMMTQEAVLSSRIEGTRSTIDEVYSLGYVTLGINSATIALLLGYGYSKLTMILNAARVFVFRVPVLWAFQQFSNIGVEAVGLTMMISNICTGAAAICLAIPVICRIRKLIKEEEKNMVEKD